VLRTSRNALAADPLLAAEAELHLAFEYPHDLLICVTMRLDMDAGPYAPPLVAGDNATADLSVICSSGNSANAPNPTVSA